MFARAKLFRWSFAKYASRWDELVWQKFPVRFAVTGVTLLLCVRTRVYACVCTRMCARLCTRTCKKISFSFVRLFFCKEVCLFVCLFVCFFVFTRFFFLSFYWFIYFIPQFFQLRFCNIHTVSDDLSVTVSVVKIGTGNLSSNPDASNALGKCMNPLALS